MNVQAGNNRPDHSRQLPAYQAGDLALLTDIHRAMISLRYQMVKKVDLAFVLPPKIGDGAGGVPPLQAVDEFAHCGCDLLEMARLLKIQLSDESRTALNAANASPTQVPVASHRPQARQHFGSPQRQWPRPGTRYEFRHELRNVCRAASSINVSLRR